MNGSLSELGPDGASRRSWGNQSRSVGTLEPRPVAGLSNPSSAPVFRRIADSTRTAPDELRAGSNGAIACTSRGTYLPTARGWQRAHVLELELGERAREFATAERYARCPGASLLSVHTVLYGRSLGVRTSVIAANNAAISRAEVLELALERLLA